MKTIQVHPAFIVAFTLLISLSIHHPLRAQEGCNQLLTHGLYDMVRQSESGADASSEIAKYCRETHEKSQNTGSMNSGGQYGVIMGHLDLSATQQKEFDDTFCSDNEAKHNSHEDFAFLSSIIGPNIRDMYEKCLESSEYLHATTDYDQESQRALTVTVWYSGKGGKNTKFTEATYISPIDKKTIDCRGDLTEVKKGDVLDERAKTVTCKRILPPQPNILQGSRMLLAEPLEIVIFTEAGVVKRTLEPLPPLPREDFIPAIPPGTVVPFAGEKIPNGWLPCDGSIKKQSDYPDLFRAIGLTYCVSEDGSEAECKKSSAYFRLPDYRGRFLRGIDGGTNRDKDRNGKIPMGLGTFQSDQVGPHTHVIKMNRFAGDKWNDTNNYNGVGFSQADGARDDKISLDTAVLSNGTSETRPMNVTVNWIIKAAVDNPPDPAYVAPNSKAYREGFVSKRLQLISVTALIIALLSLGLITWLFTYKRKLLVSALSTNSDKQ